MRMTVNTRSNLHESTMNAIDDTSGVLASLGSKASLTTNVLVATVTLFVEEII